MFLNRAEELCSVRAPWAFDYSRKVPISIQVGDLLVKTAETAQELRSIFRLRFDIFHKEYRQSAESEGLDFDEFDAHCDHLAVFDLKTHQAVGTYRLLSSEFCQTFYSQQEFVIQSILDYPGGKLELGRACIDRQYRTGSVMRLLWAGLAAYIRAVDARLLFGCSSVKTMIPSEAAGVFKFLKEQGRVSEEFSVFPAQKFKMEGFQKALQKLETEETLFSAEVSKKLVPSLLEGYLKAGGKVCGEPILDSDFHCVDFLTVLKTRELSHLFERRFKLC